MDPNTKKRKRRNVLFLPGVGHDKDLSIDEDDCGVLCEMVRRHKKGAKRREKYDSYDALDYNHYSDDGDSDEMEDLLWGRDIYGGRKEESDDEYGGKIRYFKESDDEDYSEIDESDFGSIAQQIIDIRRDDKERRVYKLRLNLKFADFLPDSIGNLDKLVDLSII